MQKPSVGRIVHYHGPMDSIRPDLPYAALVVGGVDEDQSMTVNLFVFVRGSFDENAGGISGVLDNVPFCAEGNEANTWSWPPRV